MNTPKPITATAALAAEKSDRKGFGPSGLTETIRGGRSERKEAERQMRVMCKDAISTLSYAIANPRARESSEDETEVDLTLGERKYGTPVECIAEFADIFSKLDEKHKQEVLAFITVQLVGNERHALDRIDDSESIIVIAAALSEIGKRLPVDERGNKTTTGFEKAISLLENLANGEQLFRIDPDQYASMRFACTMALWDLDFGEASFWEPAWKTLLPKTSYRVGSLRCHPQ